MYEDSWYSFVPDFQHRRGASQSHGHRRKDSLLQQPNGTHDAADAAEPLSNLYEEEVEDDQSPPEATLARRAKSYSDFYDIVKAQLSPRNASLKKKRRRRRRDREWEALEIAETPVDLPDDEVFIHGAFQDELLEASQQEYLLYCDQLAMTERHLETLVQDANEALGLLESLSKSFRSVEDQTSSFQSQCDDLLSEQRRLQKLADDVGTDLHYYAYLDNVSRRLNAPGASRLVDDEAFGEVLANLDACIAFMTKNPTYRDAESYLARYQALLTKALHLLEVGFTNRLEKVSTEISKQIAGTQSESARHALAYGRFEEMLMDCYSLIPNVQKIALSAYDQSGFAKLGGTFDIYSNTANNLFQAYYAVRDRDLKSVTQSDLETFRSEVKESSVETAARNFIKQCFERSYNEAELFRKIFAIEPHYSTELDSVFAVLKSHQRSLVNGVNITPIANHLQSTLQAADLQTICNVLGWLTSEYLLPDYDEDETPFARQCRELTARLLAEHLWTFSDAVFEAEIAKSITRAQFSPDHLKIGPATNGVASSNAYPPIKRAIELLVMFDQSMPKERCQRNSPVVYKIVKESIAVLQRAEVRIRASKSSTDPDLFMIKNLLILKNELMSLEIGDVRNGEGGPGGAMQHFGQIWETLTPQGLLGLLSNIGSYIPLPALPTLPSAASSLWLSRSGTPASSPSPSPSAPSLARGNSAMSGSNAATTTADPTASSAATGAGTGAVSQDAGEHLDELLRQSIYAFTHRWATQLNDARRRGGGGGRNAGKVERELDEMLDRAFSHQPEVVAKLKEAIQINAQAQSEAATAKATATATSGRGKAGGFSRVTRV